MAEFSKIMRGYVAMCKANQECDTCPLLEHDTCVPLGQFDNGEIARMEYVIEQWLKDHPLPSTPSWVKWLSEMGVIDSVENGNVKLLPMAYYPMDDEIASKVGAI